ncbi:unnamed protein product [Vitrella brassicaformis CCMP3155]|uniref:Uncharacterized protein n=1 Tax=Vitrella brassicaformis (strain CCMP3155) TaxID=1169540 RepID=A0A0G4H6P3_VITBC|nr:unnamed protein product [Vitrella brassicaformis CCMP3155]|eukprot:CEM39499.1 unnamed protein product [Vitrella brassicaformis CCMP3155]
MDYLLRMTHIVEEGGPWERCLQLLHLLKNCGHLPSLPIIITPDDVRQVGTKMVFDSQPPAMRQLSLFRSRADDVGFPSIFSKRIKSRDRQALTEAFNRFLTPDMLPGDLPAVHTSDPPVIYDRYGATSSSDIAASFTDMCLYAIFTDIAGIHGFVEPDEIMTRTAQQQLMERLGQLTSRMDPTWSGSRLAYVWMGRFPEWGWCNTNVVVCGDKATDEFAALVHVDVFHLFHQPSQTCDLWIVTTEPRVPRQRSSAQRCPRTAALIRAKVDAMEAESLVARRCAY